jgi:hypothetical protein
MPGRLAGSRAWRGTACPSGGRVGRRPTCQVEARPSAGHRAAAYRSSCRSCGRAGRCPACLAMGRQGAALRASEHRRARAAVCRSPYRSCGRRACPMRRGGRSATAWLRRCGERDWVRRGRICLESVAHRPAARRGVRLGRHPDDRVGEILPWHRDGLRRPQAQGFSPRHVPHAIDGTPAWNDKDPEVDVRLSSSLTFALRSDLLFVAPASIRMLTTPWELPT